MTSTGARQDLLPPQDSAVLGGPLGRYARARESSAARLLPIIVALAALPVLGGLLRQGHCMAKGWNGEEQFWRGCFSDLPAQYQLGRLDGGIGGWLSGTSTPEGMPLIGAVGALVGGLVPSGPVLTQTRWYVAIWVLLVAMLLAWCVWCLARLRPDRLDLATQLALSPALVIAGLLTPDLLVVALVLGAMLAQSRGRPLLAGVLLGLGVLGHAWVLAVALALVIASPARRRGRRDKSAPAPAVPATPVLAVAALTLASVVGALLLVRPGLVTDPLRQWWGQPSGYGALVHVPSLLGHPLPTWTLTVVALLGWGLAGLLGLLLVREAPRPPTWAQTAACMLPALVLAGRSVPVQAVLWMLPLAILAGVTWRAHLGIVAVEALHAGALWLHIGWQSDPDKGLPPAWYAVVVLARTMAWAVFAWSIWRAATSREGDRPGRPSTGGRSAQTPSTAEVHVLG